MKHIIPFGDRILVKRKKVGDAVGDTYEKDGVIVRPESNKSAETDLATVVYIPELSFIDKYLIEHSEEIVDSLDKKAREGDTQAFDALLTYNHYLKIKTLKPGDEIFMGKYVGTTFYDSNARDDLTMVRMDDIIGMVSGG